jgi:protein-S-isoprenylcysteine O-methyltransferase Ste14
MTAIALGLLFGLGWVLIFALRAEAMGAALPYYSARERFWVRVAPLVIALHVTLACGAVSALHVVPRLRGVLGIAIYAAALVFWLRARAQIGPLDRRPLPDEAPPTLRRDGPFGMVRNPLYLAYLAAAAAPAIVAGTPLLALTWLAAFAALAVRAAQEERRLHAQLGPAYAAYCREVKSLIPYLW